MIGVDPFTMMRWVNQPSPLPEEEPRGNDYRHNAGHQYKTAHLSYTPHNGKGQAEQFQDQTYRPSD